MTRFTPHRAINVIVAIIIVVLVLAVVVDAAGARTTRCQENGDGPITMTCHRTLEAGDRMVAWTHDSERLYGIRFEHPATGRQFLPGAFDRECREQARWRNVRVVLQRGCDGRDRMVVKVNAGRATFHWERLR